MVAFWRPQVLNPNLMEEHMNAFLIETADGPQGIVWADDPQQAQVMAEDEMQEVGRVEDCKVRPVPNYNLIFGEE